ncbi:hypothetical protein D3C86_2211730 [compost metagenome]
MQQVGPYLAQQIFYSLDSDLIQFSLDVDILAQPLRLTGQNHLLELLIQPVGCALERKALCLQR